MRKRLGTSVLPELRIINNVFPAQRRTFASSSPSTKGTNSLIDAEFSASFENEWELKEMQKMTKNLFGRGISQLKNEPSGSSAAIKIENFTAEPKLHLAEKTMGESDHSECILQQWEENEKDHLSLLESLLRRVSEANKKRRRLILEQQHSKILLALIELLVQRIALVGVSPIALSGATLTVLEVMNNRLIELTAKESVFLSQTILPLTVQELYAQEASSLIISALYLHRNSARRYQNLATLKLLSAVRCDFSSESQTSRMMQLYKATVEYAIWHCISSRDSNAKYISGILVSQVLQDTLLFSWSVIDVSLRQAAFLWLRRQAIPMRCFASAMKREQSTRSVSIPQQFKIAESYMSKGNNQVVAHEREVLRSLIGAKPLRENLNADFSEELYRSSLVFAGSQGASSLDKIISYLRSLKMCSGVDYIKSIEYIHKEMLALKTTKELYNISDVLVKAFPAGSTMLLQMWFASLAVEFPQIISAVRYNNKESSRLIKFLYRLLPHADIVAVCQGMLDFLMICDSATCGIFDQTTEQMLRHIEDVVSLFLPLSIVPVVIEQLGLRREVASFPCCTRVLRFLVRILEPVPFQFINTSVFQKSLNMFVGSEQRKASIFPTTVKNEDKELLFMLESYYAKSEEYNKLQLLLTSLFGNQNAVNRSIPLSSLLEAPLVSVDSTKEVEALKKIQRFHMIMNDVEKEYLLSRRGKPFPPSEVKNDFAEKGLVLLTASEGKEFEGISTSEEGETQRQRLYTAAADSPYFQELLNRSNAKTLTNTFIRFFVNVVYSQTSRSKLPADEAQINHLRRRMHQNLLSVPPETVDSVLYYIFVPSRVCLLSHPRPDNESNEVDPTNEILGKTYVKIHSIGSVFAEERVEVCGVERFIMLSEIGFKYLQKYSSLMDAREAEERSLLTDRKSKLLMGWHTWMEKVILCCYCDLLFIYSELNESRQKTPSYKSENDLYATSHILQIYKSVLDLQDSNRIKDEEFDVLFPEKIQISVLDRLVVDSSCFSVDHQVLLQQLVERRPEIAARIAKETIQKLLVTYIVTQRSVPQVLRKRMLVNETE